MHTSLINEAVLHHSSAINSLLFSILMENTMRAWQHAYGHTIEITWVYTQFYTYVCLLEHPLENGVYMHTS